LESHSPVLSLVDDALRLSPRAGSAVCIRACALVTQGNQLEMWIGGGPLRSGFGPLVEVRATEFAGDVGVIRDAVELDSVTSAVLLLEAGPDGGVLHGSLRGRRLSIDLYRARPQFVTLRLDASSDMDLRNLWDPLEIHVLGIANRRSNDTQCVISGLYSDYPRRRAPNVFIERFKLQAANLERGENGDIIMRRGTCIFSNPQRTAVEVVCHDWAGVIVLRRGPLLNTVDLYAAQRGRGMIISESCDIAMGRNTGLGVGEVPFFSAFLDVFNP
jgi:hypothetical protein